MKFYEKSFSFVRYFLKSGTQRCTNVHRRREEEEERRNFEIKSKKISIKIRTFSINLQLSL